MSTLAGEVIEEGQITVHSSMKRPPYNIKILNQSDITAVMQLQGDILATLKQKELYVPIPFEELQVMLAGNGELVGLFMHKKLYAVCGLLFPVSYENNMARELHFSEEDLALVAQLELSLVHAELRGHKLQQKLAGILASRVKKRRDARYLFTTVSPYNYPSIQTVTSLGMQIAKLGKMYYGWDRYIVYRDFMCPTKLDITNTISLPNTAFAEQQHLLNNGYRGYSACKDQDGIKIRYAKIIC